MEYLTFARAELHVPGSFLTLERNLVGLDNLTILQARNCPIKNDWVHFNAFLFIPNHARLWRSFRWFTLWKALLKSKSIKSVCFPKVSCLPRSRNSCWSSWRALWLSWCLEMLEAIIAPSLYIEYMLKKWAYNLTVLFCHPFGIRDRLVLLFFFFSILKEAVQLEEFFFKQEADNMNNLHFQRFQNHWFDVIRPSSLIRFQIW